MFVSGIFLLVCLLLLGGCSNPEKSATEMQSVRTRLKQQYAGQNVDRMIMQFGAPAAVTPMSGGKKHYTFRAGSLVQASAYGGRAEADTVRCDVLAVVDSKGIVLLAGTHDRPSPLYGSSYCKDIGL